ncbi:hypothetical protein GCM10007973_11690 [Polymorphobacter multimanifer]|uniref:hypothetical protein n=1 Tax=Polymorphobacter multimanifer TaxID=1070431 RepID=UPI00166DDEC2|nr:hypothetical protein [Polymorphobacter multimanifer]GGI76476.1 hypothetical protein GCM10007973_11690 [Polymorphobacter multimanifer]
MLSVETLLVLGGTALINILIFAGLAAWAWVSWLKLRAREMELQKMPANTNTGTEPVIGQRIDLADLKERVRKLEAIASGVDF